MFFSDTLLALSWKVSIVTGWVYGPCLAGALALPGTGGLLECCAPSLKMLPSGSARPRRSRMRKEQLLQQE